MWRYLHLAGYLQAPLFHEMQMSGGKGRLRAVGLAGVLMFCWFPGCSAKGSCRYARAQRSLEWSGSLHKVQKVLTPVG